ncbi:hypothetical protein PG991_016055 [Apiospora marii]|uniref:Uncharacterized protein n=1 Tax=Apiospora marii TaxID=335849 RepID=A0ABR1R295_9PEZI
MSYGPPTSGAGSSHWGGYGRDYPAGGGDNDDYYPPTRGPPPTSSYYSTAPAPSYTGLYEDSNSDSQDQADIDEAMRENHALGTRYFSRAGRHVATETESTQLGVDGRPMLPGDVDRYTLRGEARDSSPGRTPRGRGGSAPLATTAAAPRTRMADSPTTTASPPGLRTSPGTKAAPRART